MADDNAAAKAPDAGGEKKSGDKKPVVLYALIVLNMFAFIGVGALLYLGRVKDQANAQVVDKAAQNLVKEKEGDADKDKEESEEFVGQMIPLETFLVNLSGSRGNKLLKVNMELEVEGSKIAEELDKRKPQIRDIIIILLSSKTYAQLESAEGKEFLRDEIRDTVNSFLTKGKIKRVHFTEFIVN